MKDIFIKDYIYELPENRIAKYPLPERDKSNLLIYNKGNINHQKFYNLPDFLPAHSRIFFNDTKVIPARIHFQKDTGAHIEIFLLSPVLPSSVMSMVMESTQTCAWQCTIGNQKKWKDGIVLKKNISGIILEASLLNKNSTVVFTWNSGHSFAEVLQASGETPLPPYIDRSTEDTDKERYQTVYSNVDGAVAAPTAGLHFTPEIIERLKKNNVALEYLTLHVSAGTFQPVKVKNVIQHIMHSEQIVINKSTIQTLAENNYFNIAAGTTALRTLESVYWFGVKLLRRKDADFSISQSEPYEDNEYENPSLEQSLEAVLNYMNVGNLQQLTGKTSLMILPGYQFKVVQGLITNFHQPGSTLMLLVAAFIGESWKTVYQEALDFKYRFLSYGDSSLLIP